MVWPFKAIIKYLAWCVRVHIYTIPFQAFAFYFEFKTQNVYSVLYIPEIIAFLYFASFPLSLRLLQGGMDDIFDSSSANSPGNNLERGFKSISSIFNIQDTQNKMWLVPFIFVYQKLWACSNDRHALVFTYLQLIGIIFFVFIFSWLPIIPFFLYNSLL